jgi:hypothetical protein
MTSTRTNITDLLNLNALIVVILLPGPAAQQSISDARVGWHPSAGGSFYLLIALTLSSLPSFVPCVRLDEAQEPTSALAVVEPAGLGDEEEAEPAGFARVALEADTVASAEVRCGYGPAPPVVVRAAAAVAVERAVPALHGAPERQEAHKAGLHAAPVAGATLVALLAGLPDPGDVAERVEAHLDAAGPQPAVGATELRAARTAVTAAVSADEAPVPESRIAGARAVPAAAVLAAATAAERAVAHSDTAPRVAA